MIKASVRGKIIVLKLTVSASLLVPSAAAQIDVGALYSHAQQAQAAGDLGKATSDYEAIVRAAPQMAEAYANLGNLYYQQKQLDPAKTAYEKAVHLKPDLAGPQFFLGVIAFGAHDYTTALRYLRKAEGLQASNALIHAYLGYTFYARSTYRDAAEELEKAAALDPGDIDELYHLSKSYGHLGDDAFERLQSRFANSSYTALARAHVYESQENWKAAGEQYKLALSAMPESARLKEKVSWIAFKLSDPAAAPAKGAGDPLIDGSLAFRDARLAGAQLADEIASWQSKVRGWESAGGARELYLSAEGYQILSYLLSLAVIDRDSDSYRAHQLQAQLLEISNKDEEAIAEYRKALERKPDLQNIHFAIGSLYWKDQAFDAARPELQSELKANPNHPQALYELGDIAAMSGDAQAAEKQYLAALKVDPSFVQARLGLEKIYTQSGRYEQSIEQLRKVLTLAPADASVHYRLAAVYRKAGKVQDADRELAIFNQKGASGKQ